ncbi:hypothetical protein JXA70_09080 [candidate division KSB1 bacterium]|nr:hypothetical protein [candidate division KSB1 bacterium]
MSTDLLTSLSSINLADYDYAFVCLGIYPNNYVLQDGENVDKLITYLDNGGRLYMEGGDTWARDFPTDLHPYFAAIGEADGTGDLTTILGHACLSDHSFDYTGAQNYVDHLAPGEGASLFFCNTAPAYGTGVAYDNGTYRTLAVSFEFGGLADGSSTKDALMADILDFFDHGCSSSGPPPLNLQAFSGYNRTVPLMWDAPPGQTTLAVNKAAMPSMVFTRAKAAPVIKPVRKERDAALIQAKEQTQSAGYQTNAYHVYRGLSANGPFTKIASNIKRQYFRDSGVDNSVTYYYVVTANYGGSESDYSVVGAATPQSDGARVTSVWKNANLTIDGFIDPAEWSGATIVDIRNTGQTEPVFLYLLNNNDYLYIAVDDVANTSAAVDDQLGIYVDADRNYEWSSGTLLEGNFWYPWNGGGTNELYRALDGWWPENIDWDDPVPSTTSTSAASTVSGHVQYEIQFSLQDITLPPEMKIPINCFLYSLDMPDSLYRAAWPTTVLNTSWSTAWLAAALYGTLEISGESDCPSMMDNQSIASSGLYSFNENGDGHQVDIDVTSLTGEGEVTVTQYNCDYPNLPGSHPLPLYWTIAIDPNISDLQADYSFYYTDNDAAGFPETTAYWGMAWLNQASNTWTWLGGSIDATNNRVTLTNLSKSGVFVLYRRLYGDVTGDGYVDLDDFQRFGDVWNATSATEFPLGSDARFFNYGKRTNDSGEQIIDLDDFQILGDVWNNGVKP